MIAYICNFSGFLIISDFLKGLIALVFFYIQMKHSKTAVQDSRPVPTGIFQLAWLVHAAQLDPNSVMFHNSLRIL